MKPGFPDRVEMRDLNIGERAFSTTCTKERKHRTAPLSRFFVREGLRNVRPDKRCEVMRIRLLGLRAFDAGGMMLDADLVD
jgi:hypothetical protein